jgi:hypothetical protein
MFSNSLSLRGIRALANSMNVETLRVAEAQSSDANRGIVRIDPGVIRELSLASDDVTEITGTKKTVALVWPGYEGDSGKGLIRMDGYARNSAGVSIDASLSSCVTGNIASFRSRTLFL